MKTSFPKRAKDIKGAVAIAELKRAHFVIVILATAFAATISFTPILQLQFDTVLGFILVILLAIVAIVSLGTALMLRKR
jgi:membrane glycosyltransferase